MQRFLKALAVCLIAPVAGYLLAAWIGALLPGELAEIAPAEEGEGFEILLVSGPIHFDLLLPATPRIRAGFGFAANEVPVDNPAAEWIVVGWGAREFYTSAGSYADIRPAAVISAIAGDASVLRVDVAGRIPEGLDLPRLQLSEAQLAALLDQIMAELESFNAIPGVGFSETDAFYPARSRFHVFRTCNQWVGEVLRGAGVPVGAWTPTPYSLRSSLAFHSED